MKQYKKPTRTQKEVLTAHDFKPADWRFVSESETDYEYINPKTQEVIFLDKYKRIKSDD
jgi:hypothetical protein